MTPRIDKFGSSGYDNEKGQEVPSMEIIEAKEEFAEKVKDNIIKRLSEHGDVEIEMEDK